MTRITKSIALIAASALATEAFTVSNSNNKVMKPLRMSDDDSNRQEAPVTRTIERGVSLDQDGKSNVWAIEPKMEVDSKSSEEQASSALFAVGGLAAFAAIAAGILTNLPDPDQF